MNPLLERLVRIRAGHRCEYCHESDLLTTLKHVIDHIIARQHHGSTVLENLALCCGRCNRFKGPNIAGIDIVTGELTGLFNPRKDLWNDHFRWSGTILLGVTPIGRVTADVLSINSLLRTDSRQALMIEGRFPPPEDAQAM